MVPFSRSDFKDKMHGVKSPRLLPSLHVFEHSSLRAARATGMRISFKVKKKKKKSVAAAVSTPCLFAERLDPIHSVISGI